MSVEPKLEARRRRRRAKRKSRSRPAAKEQEEAAVQISRALASLLTRRFSPRGILPRARATLWSASGRPSSSRCLIHTLPKRDLNLGHGARGALAAGALAALAGTLYFKKGTDVAVHEVTGLQARSEVTDREGNDIINDAAIRVKFMDKDGNFAGLEYIDYINFRRRYPEVTDPEVLDEMLRRRYTVSYQEQANVKTGKQEVVRVDEAAMKARFEDWMKAYGRTYETEEEKARRYEIFKEKAIRADKANASFPNGARLAPNNLGDWTKEELYRQRSHQGDFPWESYIRRMSTMYAERRVDGVPGTVDVHHEVECTEAVKQRFKELSARKAEQDARKAKGVHQPDNL